MISLDVYLQEDLVGALERHEQAQLSFRYRSEWVEEGGGFLSLSLPLREEPFDDEECRPFFAGLLPEGEFLRSIARFFQVSAENPFSVLQEIGGECAGAVSLAPPGSEPPFLNTAGPRWLDGGDLEKLLEGMPSPALLPEVGEEGDGFRLSLAGTRDKLPVLCEGDRIGITRGNPPSTHIIKKPVAELQAMVANEAYCLALAAESGLDTAHASPLAAGEQEGLLVRRYDRWKLDSDEVMRIHQEDFCQALGVLPDFKYQNEGGPGIADGAKLIRQYASAPAVDLLGFLDALLYNLLIGNTDAHGKNFSLLLDGQRGPRLAPLYDLLSARAYWPFRRKMAMKYGGEYRGDRIRGRHLDRLAAELEIAPAAVRRRAREMGERVLAAAPGARERLPEPWQSAEILASINQLVGDTAEELRRAADEPV
ncbi:MAG TPA: type II toxin-antitoxin system HipA family toxin [Solirubrobacterales bacterium]|nr:type II toxin-antitoxin system HipA family toxin [Solirubrobacterales bacterium]